MRILYGVQGTGNGHISRSREVVRELKKRGHEVQVIFSGRDPKTIFDIDVFNPFHSFKGFTFAINNGQVSRLKTAFSLDIPRFYKDIRNFDARGVDLAVVDYEPLTSRIAKRNKIPSVGIGHQYAFKYKIPISSANPMDKLIMNIFAPAEHNLGLHWHHFGQYILPPIIPPLRRDPSRQRKNKILVYLLFEERAGLLKILRNFKEHQFFVYDKVDSPSDEGNIHIRPLSRNAFLDDLFECEGVISNAGFELPSEAIHLGKKLLLKAVAGQLEQCSNALAIEKLGFGMTMKDFNPAIIEKWLNEFKTDGCIYPDDTVARICDWLEAGNLNDISSLSKSLWNQTKMGFDSK